MSALGDLARLLIEEGGLLADVVTEPDPHADPHVDPHADPHVDPPEPLGALAASGPRAEGHEAEYALLVESIREGYLLHYGVPRVVTGADPDLALLAGDRLYALGLSRLADLGDLEAVGELADVISLCAQAQAAGDKDLAEAVWEAGAVAVGWGATAAHDAAKGAARAGDHGAAEALSAAARRPTANTAPPPPSPEPPAAPRA